MRDMKNVLAEIKQSLGQLQGEYPEFAGAFHGFMEASEKPGTLSKKQKELISTALSIQAHCEWCIAFHVHGALEAGASKDEVMEASFVAVLMGGAPSLMYMQLVMKALEDFQS